MSVTIRQRLAKGLRWTARVIGLGGTVSYLFWWFAYSQFGYLWIRSGTASIFLAATVIIALAGCITSWWRGWLASVLLIISWLTSLGVVIYAITGQYVDGGGVWLSLASPLLIAGVLLLSSWWLSRKTSPSALLPSPRS